MSGGSKSSSTSSNPVTSGYQYGGAQQGQGVGFQATPGDDLVDGGALAVGSRATSINGSDGATVIRNDLSAGALNKLLGAAGAAQANVSKLSDDAITQATKTANGAIATNAKLSDDANARQAKTAQGAIATNAKLADNANARNAKIAAGAIATNAKLSDDAMNITGKAAASAANSAAKAAGMAVDANTDTVKRAFDFGDKTIDALQSQTGETQDTIRAALNDALGAASDAYSGALDTVQQNAKTTAAAYQSAAGGQTQATQETVRKIAFAMVGGLAFIAMFNN